MKIDKRQKEERKCGRGPRDIIAQTGLGHLAESLYLLVFACQSLAGRKMKPTHMAPGRKATRTPKYQELGGSRKQEEGALGWAQWQHRNRNRHKIEIKVRGSQVTTTRKDDRS